MVGLGQEREPLPGGRVVVVHDGEARLGGAADVALAEADAEFPVGHPGLAPGRELQPRRRLVPARRLGKEEKHLFDVEQHPGVEDDLVEEGFQVELGRDALGGVKEHRALHVLFADDALFGGQVSLADLDRGLQPDFLAGLEHRAALAGPEPAGDLARKQGAQHEQDGHGLFEFVGGIHQRLAGAAHALGRGAGVTGQGADLGGKQVFQDHFGQGSEVPAAAAPAAGLDPAQGRVEKRIQRPALFDDAFEKAVQGFRVDTVRRGRRRFPRHGRLRLGFTARA